MGYKVKYYLTTPSAIAGCKFVAPLTGDSGHDIHANAPLCILPQESKVISTGLYLSIHPNLVGIIKDRKTLALKGLRVMAGLIDASFRDEVSIFMANTSNSPYHVQAGDRVAQILFLLLGKPAVIKTSYDKLGPTRKGRGGI